MKMRKTVGRGTGCRRFMGLAIGIGLLVFGVLPAFAANFYVDVSWTGPWNGTTNEPYRTIKSAVDVANAAGTGPHTIFIAAGWYGDVANDGTENYSAGGGSDHGILITQRINIYGGYAGWNGDGTDPENFDWTEGTRVPRTTIIDLKDADSRAFRHEPPATGSIFDGLTFQNADITGNGGAILSPYAYSRTLYIANCLFTNNLASAQGGAVHLYPQYVRGSWIRDSDFEDNEAGTDGGAVWLFCQSGDLTVEDSTFLRNEAGDQGGAILWSGNAQRLQYVSRCRFEGNSAVTRGGAIYSRDPRIQIEQSVFVGNSAPSGAAVGGQHYWVGSYVLQNCLVYGNTGGYAVHAEGARMNTYTLDILHSTIVGNPGGGIRFGDTDKAIPARVRNSIIAFNGGYGVYRAQDDYTFSHNNVYGNTNDYFNCEADADSIALDPEFIDADNDDYRLAITSPSIDAGADDTGLAVDLVGTLRPTRNGWDQGAIEEAAACRIQNLAPATTATSVTLRGELLHDGGLDTHVHIYWGLTDGGTNRQNWAHTNIIGLTEAPNTFAVANAVETGETYWFRCYASNSYDEVWADSSWSFTAEDVHLWTGLAGDGLASTPGNWFEDFLPTVNGTVMLDSYQADMTWDAAAPHRVHKWVQTDQYGGTVTIATGWSNSFDRLTIDTDMIVAGGTLTHLPNDDVPLYRLKLDIGGDFELATGLAVTADGRGFARAQGPGAGVAVREGGTHGGEGFMNSKACYGSVWEPVDLGSGGGGTSGRAGGGAVFLTVGGTATVGGTISANADLTSGNFHNGGAGGSVLLRAGQVSGAGSLCANGSGSGYDTAAGGGGRVALIVTNDTAFGELTLTAFGHTANAQRNSAAGTVYKQSTEDLPQQGIVVIDNDNIITRQARTVIPADHSLDQFAEIVLDNAGVLGFDTGVAFDFSDLGNLVVNGPEKSYIAVRDLTDITFPANFTIAGYTLRLDAPLAHSGNWTIAANGSLSHSSYENSDDVGLYLTLTGNLTVDGAIDVRLGGYFRSDGYGQGRGPGFSSGNAGSYGGRGYDAGEGLCYGSILNPVHLGSGAHGHGFGGGRARLTVAGNTAVSGSILVGCFAINQRNGSGGSLALQTGTLSGSGRIDATGGRSVSPGPTHSEIGGGGGRIRVKLTDSDSFGDIVFAANGGRGGSGNTAGTGGAGTIYLERASETAGGGRIVIGNADNTPMRVTEFPPTQLFDDDLSGASLEITDGALVRLTGNVTVNRLSIGGTTMLDLDGYTLTVVEQLIVGGIEQKWGDYPASAFDETIDSDPEDKGLIHVVPPPPGSLFIIR